MAKFKFATDEELEKIFKWAEENEDNSLLAEVYLAACGLVGALDKNNEIEDMFWEDCYRIRDKIGREILRKLD